MECTAPQAALPPHAYKGRGLHAAYGKTIVEVEAGGSCLTVPPSHQGQAVTWAGQIRSLSVELGTREPTALAPALLQIGNVTSRSSDLRGRSPLSVRLADGSITQVRGASHWTAGDNALPIASSWGSELGQAQGKETSCEPILVW
jgi:hypothetical protein